MKMRKMNGKLNNKGFSMIELIIIIAILAILTAIIAPNLIRYMKKAQKVRDADTARVMGQTLERVLILDSEAAKDWDKVTKKDFRVGYRVPKDGGETYILANVFEYAMTAKGEIVKDPKWSGCENNYQNGIIRDARKDCGKLAKALADELPTNYNTIAYRDNDLRIFRVGKNLDTGEVEVWACIIPRSTIADGYTDGLGTTNGRVTYKLYPEVDPKYYSEYSDPQSINAFKQKGGVVY